MTKRTLTLAVASLIASIFTMLSMPGTVASAQVKDQRDLRLKSNSVNILPSSTKRYALVIGVDQYDDPQIPQLEGATNDAKSLAETLIKYAGFPKEQVFLLTSDQPSDRRPTKANILRRFSNLRLNIPKDGLLLVSFAGHGIERDGHAYLLPADAQANADVVLLEETSIKVERAKSLVKQLGVKQVLIILDACRNYPEEGRSIRTQPLTEAYTRGFGFDRVNEGIEAFAVLYATENGLVAYENKDKKQGYFSLALIEGLKGAAGNEKGEVTLAGLVKYIQEVVPRRVALDLGKGKEQRPFANIEGYKADELVLAIIPVDKPVASKPVANESGGYHSLAFEAAEKANKGDYDGAISDYNYALKLDPAHADEYKKRIAEVYGNRGYAKFHQADFEGASKDFTEAIKMAPNAILYNARGTMRANLRDNKGAIEDYTKAIELNSNFAIAYSNRGRMYEARGEKEKASKDYEVAKQIDSEIYTNEKGVEKNSELMSKVQTLIDSGNEKANKGNYDGAIEDFTRAINLNPKNTTPYYLRGNAKFNREYFIGFSVDYKLAAANNSQCKCLDKDDYEMLLAEITKAIGLDSNSPILYQNRGMLYAARGEVRKAVEDFRKAIEINPKYYIAYMAWGLITIPSDAKAAVKTLTKAIEINPNSGAAYYLRYEAKYAMGTKDKEDLDQAIKFSSEDFTLLLRRSGVIQPFDHLPWIRR